MQLQFTLFGDSRLPPRFWSKVQVSPDGCWLWTGHRDRRGYARYWLRGTYDSTGKRKYHWVRGHRIAYESLIGPIPPNREIDHLCRVLCCVNPTHLEAVPHIVNVRRGNAGRYPRDSHCAHGHLLDKLAHKCCECARRRALARYYRITYGADHPRSSPEAYAPVRHYPRRF